MVERDVDEQGREEASDFESFFLAHHGRLLRSLVVVTRDAHAADDLAQEAFVRVWERWERVGAMADPTGYLYRVALNLHFSAHRRAMRAVRRRLLAGPVADPLEQVEARDVAARALLSLPVRQRAALVATEYLGLDSAAAATAMGIRPGTVRRLVSQARARLGEGNEGRGEEHR